MKKIIPLLTLSVLALIMGCSREATYTPGLNLTNELSTTRMQPGGTIILRTSINNLWDNELRDSAVKLTKSYGSRLVIEPSDVYEIDSIQDNPNVTARAQWSLSISPQATSGEKFDNVVRLCFNYTQTAWHEISLVNSFDVESEPKSGSDTGPLSITFTGLEEPYVYNEQIKSKIPLSISIRNNYNGYIGTINMPKGDVPNITRIVMKIYDGGGGLDNASPQVNFRIIENYNNPRQLICNDNQWNEEDEYFECYIDDLPVFGETFIGTRLNITNLQEEELIEKVEVTVDYTYCVESESFTLEVFQPGG